MNRVQRGVPTGGQFAARGRAEASVSLSVDVRDDDPHLLADNGPSLTAQSGPIPSVNRAGDGWADGGYSTRLEECSSLIRPQTIPAGTPRGGNVVFPDGREMPPRLRTGSPSEFWAEKVERDYGGSWVQFRLSQVDPSGDEAARLRAVATQEAEFMSEHRQAVARRRESEDALAAARVAVEAPVKPRGLKGLFGR